MLSNKELRANARKNLGGSLFANLWLMTIVVILVVDSVLSFASSFLIGGIVLSGPLAYALAKITVSISKGKREIDFNDLLSGFKDDFENVLLLEVLKDLFVFLWALLFVIPGIVKFYSYSMATYLQQDSDNKNWRSCLDESCRIMNGNKMKLFLLDLSFIGWYIVGFLCFVIGTLWVSAYHRQSRAEFYRNLIDEDRELKVENVQ